MTLRNLISQAFSFASRPLGGSSAATAGALYSDQAVGSFTDSLFGLADPDEILRKANLSRTDLRPLEYDDEIEAALDTRLSAVLAREWRLEPAGPDADKLDAELRPKMEAIITGAWRANLYGYSVMEAVYRKPTGEADRLPIGLDTIAEKPFEWFRPLRDGRLRYRKGFGDEVDVDTTRKFFLTRRKASFRNPAGESILSRLYWPHFFKSSGWRFFSRFLERHGAPLLVGQTNGDTTKLAAALARAAQSGAVAVGVGDKVDSVAPHNEGKAFELFLDMTNRRIQKVILGQTLTTEAGKVGSYALGKVHDQVRGDRVLADIRMVLPTVQAIISALCGLNGIRAVPSVAFDTGRDLSTDRAERDARLVDSGIVELSEKYVLDRYDFEPGDFAIPTRAPAAIDPPRRGMKASATMFAASRKPQRFTAGQAAIEDLGDEAIAQAGDPISAADIRAMIEAAESPEDLVERMADRFGALPRDEFRETLERALFAADVMGYAHAAQGSDPQ